VETQVMNRTTNHRRIAVALTFGLAAGALLVDASSTAAQEAGSRYRVLVPALMPEGGAKDDFGKKVAEEVRKRIDDMATHAPFEGGDLKDALKRVGVKEEDLADCVKARQLAGLNDIPLVMCGTYQDAGGGMTVQARVISTRENDQFDVPEFTSSDPRQAAQQIVDEFANYTQMLSQSAYCHENLTSQLWSQALENCNQALAVAPNAKSALYGRGQALWKLDSLDAALATFQKLLDVDQVHTDALLSAGLVATELEQSDVAREYFRTYMDLNPGDVSVRVHVANEVAQAGDPESALMMVEEGIAAVDSVDLGLVQYAGQLALRAALGREDTAGAGSELAPEARALYEKSITYLDQVFEAKGDSVEPAIIRNMAAALNKLGEHERTIQLAERAIQRNMLEDADLWLAYGDALKETGDLDGALEALRTAAEKDPEARVYARMATYLLQAGRLEEAAEPGRMAVERGELDGNTLASQMTGLAFRDLAQKGEHAAAIRVYEMARPFATSEEGTDYVDFFHGYAIFMRARDVQEPSTAASAKQALPMFQRALQLMQTADKLPPEQLRNREAIIGNINEYIEIQELLIKRG
jgi:tetratricopeptide (TPR) repeat protein